MLAAKETHQGTGLTSFVTPFFIPMTFALATRVESPDLVEQSTLSSSSSKKLMMVMNNDGVGRFLSGCFSELICRLRSLLDDLHGMLHVNLRSGSFSIGT